jgi:acetyl-CoA C-acetyltransferase
MVEAYLEAMQDAGVETSQIQAAWFSTAMDEQHVGKGGTPLSVALRLPKCAGDACREFLRQRLGSVSRRGLCGRGRRLRHRARARRRES